MLDACEVKDLLDYCPESGEFVWKPRPVTGRADKIFNTRYAGKKAGTPPCPRGYVYIKLRQQMIGAGRVAWAWVNGQWPEGEIDHRDGDASNNRYENLRAATRSQNAANRGRHRNNVSGFKGVYRRENGTWRAEIRFERRRIIIGTFKTPEAAHAAYEQAAGQLHGEFARAA